MGKTSALPSRGGRNHQEAREIPHEADRTIKQIEPELLVLADMAWALKAMPLVAGVTIAEDPGRTMPEAYNMQPWRRQAAITLAGSAANVLPSHHGPGHRRHLLHSQRKRVRLDHHLVEPQRTRGEAGIRPGDRLVRVRNLVHPTL